MSVRGDRYQKALDFGGNEMGALHKDMGTLGRRKGFELAATDIASGACDGSMPCFGNEHNRNNLIPAIVIPLVGEQCKICCGHR